MKKTILPVIFIFGTLVYACGGADEVAKHVLDSMITDSTNKAIAKKNTADSLKMEDSIASASKKMHEDWQADSARKADSIAKKGKK